MSKRFDAVPAFVVPVEIRAIPEMGVDHNGVFAAVPIKKGEVIWEWTDLVRSIHHKDLDKALESMTTSEAALFLRQGFVMPNDLEHFNTNPKDAGRFTNHSKTPNLGMEGALRDIEVGEEITMDYTFHGDPEWYRDICAKYNVQTEAQIAAVYA